MSGSEETEKELREWIAHYESRIHSLEHDLDTNRKRLKKAKIKLCAMSGKPVCKCKAELSTYQCFNCGKSIGPDCIGYCDEEEMSAACNHCS
jgi:predicted component of type VI protein secretion system